MLIRVEHVSKSFKTDDNWLFPRYQQVLNDVSLSLREGECLGIVGESGSGKSTLGKIILGLEMPDQGQVVQHQSLSNLPAHKALSVVFQDYNSSVNPRMTVRDIISEPILSDMSSRAERNEYVASLLSEVGLRSDMLERYPHQLSGGQLQRVCIARAIAPNPRFILLDEAVSSLDVSVQVQILDLLNTLKKKRNIAYLFITHDIAVATFLCDRLVFFKAGRIVESVDDMNQLNQPQTSYTRSLLDAAGYLDIPFLSESEPQ